MLKNYLKVTLRAFRKDIAYTLINTIGLSVGIACFILIGLFVRDEVSFDKFHENSDRIYRGILNYKEAGFITTTPDALLPALKEEMPEVENAVRISFGQEATVKYQDENIFEQESYYVDPSLFEIFDFHLAIGDEATALTVKNSLVISPYIMEKYFDGENPVGESFQFVNDTVAYTVTGVLKEIPGNSRFRFNFIRPLKAQQSERFDENSWKSNSGFIYVLTNTEIDPEEFAQRTLEVAQRRGYKLYESAEFLFEPYGDLYLHSDYSFTASGVSGDTKFIYIFSIVGVLLLLIACMNYVNLATAKAFSRSHEIGVRKIVGANKKQIQSQFMGEAFVLTTIAVIIAGGLVEYFRPTLNELAGKNITLNYFTDTFLLLSLVAIVLLVTLMAGAYPAIFISKLNPLKVLKGGTISQGKALLRKSLVIFQFSITLVLITSALIIRGQVSLFTNSEPGFNVDNLITTDPSVFVQENLDLVKTKFASIPGVSEVTASPIAWGGSSFPVKSESFEGEDKERRVSTIMGQDNIVEAFGIELVDGRDFRRGSEEDFSTALLINETAVKQFGWGVGTAMETPSFTERTYGYTPKKVIGVFKDLRLNLKSEEPPMIIQLDRMHSMVQMRIEPSARAEAINRIKIAWEELETGTPFEYRSMNTVLMKQYDKEAQTGKIFNYFSAIALLIAALGLLGLSAYTAASKRKEIGIRKVLGARISSILKLLIGSYLNLLLIALLVSVPITYYFMNDWLSEFANRIPMSWTIFATGAGISLFILLVTVGYQTLRSSMTNPTNVLRED